MKRVNMEDHERRQLLRTSQHSVDMCESRFCYTVKGRLTEAKETSNEAQEAVL